MTPHDLALDVARDVAVNPFVAASRSTAVQNTEAWTAIVSVLIPAFAVPEDVVIEIESTGSTTLSSRVENLEFGSVRIDITYDLAQDSIGVAECRAKLSPWCQASVALARTTPTVTLDLRHCSVLECTLDAALSQTACVVGAVDSRELSDERIESFMRFERSANGLFYSPPISASSIRLFTSSCEDQPVTDSMRPYSEGDRFGIREYRGRIALTAGMITRHAIIDRIACAVRIVCDAPAWYSEPLVLSFYDNTSIQSQLGMLVPRVESTYRVPCVAGTFRVRPRLGGWSRSTQLIDASTVEGVIAVAVALSRVEIRPLQADGTPIRVEALQLTETASDESGIVLRDDVSGYVCSLPPGAYTVKIPDGFGEVSVGSMSGQLEITAANDEVVRVIEVVVR